MVKLSGGEGLDKALAEIAKKLGKGGTVSVGFLAGATYPTKTKKSLRKTYNKRAAKGQTGAVKGSPDGTTVAMVTAIQNFGAPSRGIPPRPFFTNMIKDKSHEWPEAIKKQLIETGYDTEKTLERVGEGIAGQLRQAIVDTNFPPLAQRTIDAKGFAKPLVDTAHMLNSVDYEVDAE